ncbi:MAG: DUF2232 domain-containing protein [Cyanobacteria bacterium J06638_22]
MSGSDEYSQPPNDPNPASERSPSDDATNADLVAELEAVEEELSRPLSTPAALPINPPVPSPPPLVLVETAFFASTTSLLWLASYYLSLVAWMRVIFPLPLALIYLRWGRRAGIVGLVVTALLLSILMGPYLSLLFLIPYGLLGVQLGATWKHGMKWAGSITTGAILASLSFFVRVWLLSMFLGEDLWIYLTSRLADFIQWILSILVSWGWLGVGALGEVNLFWVQALTVGTVLLSDFVYLFTVHLAGWLLLERLGNPIPDPPEWVKIIFDEEYGQ